MGRFSEALVMHDLAFAKELYGVSDVGVINEAEEVIVGHSRLLLGGEILVKIGKNVALNADILGIKGNACGGHGIDPRGVIHEVGGEGGILDLLLGEASGELVEDGADHLQVRELLTTLRSIGNVP